MKKVDQNQTRFTQRSITHPSRENLPYLFLLSALIFTTGFFISSCAQPSRNTETSPLHSSQNSDLSRSPASTGFKRSPQGEVQRGLPSAFTGGEIKSAPASGKRIRPISKASLKGYRYVDCDSLNSSVPECVSIPSSIPDCFRNDYTCAMEFSYLKWKNPRNTEFNDEAMVFQCAAWGQPSGCVCPKRYDPNQMAGYNPVRSFVVQGQEGMESRVEILPSRFEDRNWFTTFAIVLSRKDASGVMHFSIPRCVTVAPLQFEFFTGSKTSSDWPIIHDTRPLSESNTSASE